MKPLITQPRVCILALPESSGSVLYGLFEVLSMFASFWAEIVDDTDQPVGFEVKIVSLTSDNFNCYGGVPVRPDASILEIKQSDIVIVTDLAVDPLTDHKQRWEQLYPWLKNIHKNGGLICSVCSGTLILAASGLLDNKPATTHWAFAKHIEKYYPLVNLCANKIIVPEQANQALVTTGGMSSWEDLALYLIARYFGEAAAVNTAKLFVMGDRRDGQQVFSALCHTKNHGDLAIQKAQLWIERNSHKKNPISHLIENSGLASRTFKRRFNRATGFTPIEYVQAIRIEKAKKNLESSDISIDEISLKSGYEDITSFRRLFKRITGVTPGKYRKRFQSFRVQ